MITAKLNRIHKLSVGVFSTLNIGTKVYCCASHAFLMPDGSYQPKLANGSYICKIGIHKLETHPPGRYFEVLNVPDFQYQKVTGLLFHPLNYPQTQSIGCEGIGFEFALDQPVPMISHSDAAFADFMIYLDGVDEFQLEVT